MDNQNNPNWPNNPTATPPLTGVTPPPDPLSSQPPPLPADPWTPPSPPLPSQPPAPENPMPTWNPNPQPASAPTSEPVPTFTQNNTSPLDNPWGSPTQPPAIDSSPPQSDPQPTWVPPTPATDTSTQAQALPNEPLSYNQPNPSPASSEPAPTDLSHLISNNPLSSEPAAPETLVVPSQGANTAEVPTVPTESHKGMPKWLIGVAIGLLVLVAGASAYFILGIGQNKQTTSVPAEVTKNSVQTPPPITTPTPQPSAPATATGSASFGQLQGGGEQQATSAADLLRQRQQAR